MRRAPHVAQASCLWGQRASRLLKPRPGRQDAHWPHRLEACATNRQRPPRP